MIPVLPLPPHWLPCQHFGVLTAWDCYRAGHQGISFSSFVRLWRDAGLEGLFNDTLVKDAFLAAPHDEGHRLPFHGFYGMLERLSGKEQATSVDVLQVVADLGSSLPSPHGSQALQGTAPASTPGSQCPSPCRVRVRPHSAHPRSRGVSDAGAPTSQVPTRPPAANTSQPWNLGLSDTLGASRVGRQLQPIRPSSAMPASGAARNTMGGARPASPTLLYPFPRRQQQQQHRQSSGRSSQHVPHPLEARGPQANPASREELQSGACAGASQHGVPNARALQAQGDKRWGSASRVGPVSARTVSSQESDAVGAGAGRDGLALPEGGVKGAGVQGSANEAGKRADTLGAGAAHSSFVAQLPESHILPSASAEQGVPHAHLQQPGLGQVEELRSHVLALQAAVAQLQRSGPSQAKLLQGTHPLVGGQQQQQQQHVRPGAFSHVVCSGASSTHNSEQSCDSQHLQQALQELSPESRTQPVSLQGNLQQQQQQQQQLEFLQQQVQEQARALQQACSQLQQLEAGMARQAEQHAAPSQRVPEAAAASNEGEQGSKASQQQQQQQQQLESLQQQVQEQARKMQQLEAGMAQQADQHATPLQRVPAAAAVGNEGEQGSNKASLQQQQQQLESLQQQVQEQAHKMQQLEAGMARQAEQHAVPSSQRVPAAAAAGHAGEQGSNKASQQQQHLHVQLLQQQLSQMQQQVARLAEVQTATEQELNSVRQQVAQGSQSGWQADHEQLRQQLKSVQEQQLADKAGMHTANEQARQLMSTLQQQQQQQQQVEVQGGQAETQQLLNAQIQDAVEQQLSSIRQQHEHVQREQQRKLDAIAAELQAVRQQQQEHAGSRQAEEQRVEQLALELEGVMHALEQQHQQQQQQQQQHQQQDDDAASQAPHTAVADGAADEQNVELQHAVPPVAGSPLLLTTPPPPASLDVWHQVQELDARVLELAARLSQQEAKARPCDPHHAMRQGPMEGVQLDVQAAAQKLEAAASAHLQQLSAEAARHQEKLAHTATAVQRVVDGHAALGRPKCDEPKGTLDAKSTGSELRRLALIITILEEHLRATDARVDNLATRHRALQGTVDNLRVSTLDSVLSLMERRNSIHTSAPLALQADVNELRDRLSRLDLQLTGALHLERSSQSLQSAPPDIGTQHTGGPTPTSTSLHCGPPTSAEPSSAPLGDPPGPPPRPPNTDPMFGASFRRAAVSGSPSRFKPRPPVKHASMSSLVPPSRPPSQLKRSSHDPLPSPLSPDSSSLKLGLQQVDSRAEAEDGDELERNDSSNRRLPGAPRTGGAQALLRSCLARPTGSMTTVHRGAVPPTNEVLLSVAKCASTPVIGYPLPESKESQERLWLDEHVHFSADTRGPLQSRMRRAFESEDGTNSSRGHRRQQQPAPSEERSSPNIMFDGLPIRPESVFRQKWARAGGEEDRGSSQSGLRNPSTWATLSQRLDRAQSTDDLETA